MVSPARTATVIAAAMMACACASMPDGGKARAPEPKQAVDAASFYSGRWYEIGRTPMKLTDGCVAGTTDYVRGKGKLIERDACRDKTPAGKEKVISGAITILNPGQNTKLGVSYRLFGFVPVPRTYWILDHGEDWFIQADPELENFNLYTRAPRPSRAVVAQITERVAATGYDVSKLEFPETFPEGQR